MKRGFCLVLIFFISAYSIFAQGLEKSATDAFLITRMAEKFHIQPRPLDESMSMDIYDRMLAYLDADKIFFTQEDINRLAPYRKKLGEEISNHQDGFLQLIAKLFKDRILQADSMVIRISRQPFNLYAKEIFPRALDSSYPSGTAGMYTKIYKTLKLLVLEDIKEVLDTGKFDIVRTKKAVDSLEPLYRKKSGAAIHRFVKRILESPQGEEGMIGNIYCEVIASSYDPHTSYFQPDRKQAFESMLGNKAQVFGFSLSEDQEGNPEIGRLLPGSPAYASGQLNEGDKITSIRWENKDPIDVSDAGLKEIDHILSQEGGNKVTLSIRKKDGTTRQVVLQKALLSETEDEDENKVKGFVLSGDKKVGYISLPDFYSDWENKSGINGCANDVAKEILKLKKENIQGLIIDLRYNGGGSLQEAVELSGIFIDAGPVAQMKVKNSKTLTLKDVNRGTIFDGPLVILVNGSTASASELVAGTLQDYNRALIVGSRTYGKATGQAVLPLDTTINLETYDGKATASSYIKLTMMKLFRVNGKTAQGRGVIPDIQLPDPADALMDRESDDKLSLKFDQIDANKYYDPLPPPFQ